MSVHFAQAADDEHILVGLAIPFGTADQRDLDGEWFDQSTDLMPDLMAGPRPVLYHHGLDPMLKSEVVGRVIDYSVDPASGVWAKVQLAKASQYAATIKELVRRGALGFSSGAVAHLVQIDKATGRILRWPLAGSAPARTCRSGAVAATAARATG